MDADWIGVIGPILTKIDFGWVEKLAAFAVFLWFTRREVRGQFKGLQSSFDSFTVVFTETISDVKIELIKFGKQILALEEKHGERITKAEQEIQLLKAERVFKAENDIALLKTQMAEIKGSKNPK